MAYSTFTLRVQDTTPDAVKPTSVTVYVWPLVANTGPRLKRIKDATGKTITGHVKHVASAAEITAGAVDVVLPDPRDTTLSPTAFGWEVRVETNYFKQESVIFGSAELDLYASGGVLLYGKVVPVDAALFTAVAGYATSGDVAAGDAATLAAAEAYTDSHTPTIASASTTAQGIVELATNTEATTGTDTVRAVTPAGVKAVTDALAFVPAAAVAVVSGTNQTAIDAAFAKVTTNGGLVIFPPGDYAGTINITVNKRIDVLAFGARILAQADNVNLVRINQGVGDTIAGASVRGFRLEGNGHAGVVGVAFEDTDGSLVGDLFIKSAAVGVLHHAAGSGKWVEGCTVDNIFTTNCGIGVEYRKEAAANPSFNECVLRDVRLSQSTSIGIKQGTGADFTRTTWDNTTVWCPNGAVGVEFGGRLDFARLQFGIESLGSGVGSTGIHITSTYTNYSDPYAHTVEASLVGSFATRILDESTGGFGVVLRDGSNFVSTNYGPIITAKHSGDTDFRLRVGPTGKYEIGDGTSSPFALLDLWYAQYVKASGNVLFQGDPGFPNANANGGSASKAIHVYGTADTYAGYVPVYATSDGPAVVPSNTQTGTTYTLVAADAGKAVTCNNAAAITLTVPPNSSVPYTIGTVISVEQLGAGQVTITPGAGVTINSRGALTKTAGQYGAASLRKIATDTWLLAGDLA